MVRNILICGLMLSLSSLANANETSEIKKELEKARAERHALMQEIKDLKNSSSNSGKSNQISWGGYGEIHYNEAEGAGGDFVDIHRLVMFMGYAFNDWIQLNSEVELEHAFVGEGMGGEYKIEQLAMDFMIQPELNIRMGRMLAPLGMINENHEPTLFNGVERPNFAKYIIPSTWSLDGIGVFGQRADLSYKVYITSFLDGSGFSEKDGIRGGRMHERPGMTNKAITTRLEYRPIPKFVFGFGRIVGGVNNGNKGKNPGIDDSVKLALNAIDVRYSWNVLDFKAAYAESTITGVDKLNEWHAAQCDPADTSCSAPNIAEKMRGNLAEVGVHVMPASMKKDKLADADLIVFVRSDTYDNQYSVKNGEKNKAGSRKDFTYGLTFLPTSQVAIKLDWQTTEDETDADAKKSFNAGLGWNF